MFRLLIRQLFPVTVISRQEHRLFYRTEFQEIMVHAFEIQLHCDVMGYIDIMYNSG
jgi:hypothetical protein